MDIEQRSETSSSTWAATPKNGAAAHATESALPRGIPQAASPIFPAADDPAARNGSSYRSPILVRRLEDLAAASSVAALAVSAVGIAAYALRMDGAQASRLIDALAIPTADSAGFLSLGFGLLVWIRARGALERTAVACTAVAAAIAGLIAAAMVLRLLSPNESSLMLIDQFDGAADMPAATATPVTSFTMLLAAATLGVLATTTAGDSKASARLSLVGALGACVLATNFVVLLGCVYGSPLADVGRANLSLDATTSFVLCCIGLALVLSAGPDHFPARPFIGRSAHAALLRAFLPTTVIVTALNGALFHVIVNTSGLNSALVLTLFAVATAIVISLVVARAASRVGGEMDDLETQRRQVEMELLAAHVDLQAAHDRLEQRVRERTAELQKSNSALQSYIAEQHSLQQALRDERNLLQILIDNVPACIYIKDRESRFVISNNMHLRQCQVDTMDQVVGKTDLDLFPHELAQQYFDDEQALIRGEREMIHHEEPIVRVGGEMGWAVTIKAPYRDGDGVIQGIVGISRDITDFKRTEELIRARDAAEESSRAKSQFLATMSHELRTPLNAIIGYSELLEEESRDLDLDGFVDDLGKIRRAGTHLLRLINDILDVSRAQSGKIQLHIEPFQIEPFLSEVVGTLQKAAADNETKLELFAAPDLGGMSADLTRLRQILLNLLGNAVKFTKYGAVHLSARRVPGPDPAGADADWIEFVVADSGIGMTEEQMERVFQPFVQADSTTSRSYGGTGLGLAITKLYCDLMGGSVSVESKINIGSTFTVRLPATAVAAGARADEAPMEGLEEQVAPVGASGGTDGGEFRFARREAQPGATIARRAPRERQSARVLLINDDLTERYLIQRFLQKQGYDVDTTTTGEEGLELARTRVPNVITLDLNLTATAGWETLAAIRADAALRAVPVVVISLSEDKQKGYALGADDFLHKPVDRNELVDVVRRHCPPSAGDERRPMILIVDDDPDFREQIARFLERAGCDSLGAPDGRAALSLLESHPIDLVLLDLMMPMMDGFEFAAIAHADRQFRSIPIVVMTAKDVTAEDRARLAGQAERVLQKGAYTRDQLFYELHRLISAHDQERPMVL